MKVRPGVPLVTVIAWIGVTFTIAVAVSFAVRLSPPPNTVAIFVRLPDPVAATLTVNVITG
jgi:hypothetical protein